MIPTIGIMVAAYAIVRLIQIPIEHAKIEGKPAILGVLSLIGAVIVGFCAFSLIMSSASASGLGGLMR